ncbi:ABC transporter ATP-binding protein [Acetobacterium tundrae]|uniref:ATP-binding cassette domain-containing protein n=1 Tax=Acetobacterium tundrae TaxID=132932 RepID=A0ABR6WJV6_9FIRM|nr:ABC transporter ATP-binding protein [Acetobacterium tundrae]MBC3796491.1 ATP-binding cassette domain-containing protein [Acetobacterium tundrae]
MKIEVNQVDKSFKKQRVLNQINLTINSGRIFCLLGASGSGKTTLLRIMMGAIRSENGTVTIGGTKVPNRQLLAEMGYMPQNEALYEELSVWENLKFFAGLHKLKRKTFEKNAAELLQVVDMLQDKTKLVRDCSGGMKKRISLAVALIHHPKLLLLDEPTVGVDPVLRRRIWEYLKQLKSSGVTILVTTHVMDEVTQCDDAALLRNGHIIAKDTVENLIGMTPNGNIEELFFMNDQSEMEGATC